MFYRVNKYIVEVKGDDIFHKLIESKTIEESSPFRAVKNVLQSPLYVLHPYGGILSYVEKGGMAFAKVYEIQDKDCVIKEDHVEGKKRYRLLDARLYKVGLESDIIHPWFKTKKELKEYAHNYRVNILEKDHG